LHRGSNKSRVIGIVACVHRNKADSIASAFNSALVAGACKYGIARTREGNRKIASDTAAASGDAYGSGHQSFLAGPPEWDLAISDQMVMAE
jgi:hypothetical protein